MPNIADLVWISNILIHVVWLREEGWDVYSMTD